MYLSVLLFFNQWFIEGLVYFDGKELSILSDIAETTCVKYAAVRQKRNCQLNVQSGWRST